MAGGFGVDPFQAFQFGQQVAGTSALGDLVKNVTQRLQSMDLLRAQPAFKYQTELPYQIALEKAKIQLDPEKRLLASMLPPEGQTTDGGVNLPNNISGGVSTGAFPPTGNVGVTPGRDMMIEGTKVGPFMMKSRSALQEEAAIKANVGLSSQFSNLQSGITLAQKAAQSLPTGQGSFGRRMTSFSTNITGGSYNPDLRQYLQWVNSSSVGLYRFITGDTRISDLDASIRAKAFVWRPDEGEPWEPVGRQKMDRLQETLKNRGSQSSGIGLDENLLESNPESNIDWD